MADDDDKKIDDDEGSTDSSSDSIVAHKAEIVARDGDGGLEEDFTVPAQLGSTKYVHAAFFAAGVLVAYLTGKILASLWNTLAEWPAAVRALPQLLRYAEDERPTFTMTAGALIGLLTVVQTYRKERIQSWADEVASELYKVHWPDKDTVSNGTIVVIVAGVFAVVYIGLLDRLWGFVTILVYGA